METFPTNSKYSNVDSSTLPKPSAMFAWVLAPLDKVKLIWPFTLVTVEFFSYPTHPPKSSRLLATSTLPTTDELLSVEDSI